MGVFFSRLRKKKETTELLEELDVEIKGCINFRLENQESQRRWVGRLTLWGIVSYVIMAFFYYLIYFPVGWVSCLERAEIGGLFSCPGKGTISFTINIF